MIVPASDDSCLVVFDFGSGLFFSCGGVQPSTVVPVDSEIYEGSLRFSFCFSFRSTILSSENELGTAEHFSSLGGVGGGDCFTSILDNRRC